METAGKPRKQRSDRGTRRLTERDLLALKWVGEQYALRLDQLQILLGRYSSKSNHPGVTVDSTTAWYSARKWMDLGLAQAEKFLTKTPTWIWLTPSGLRAVGLSFAPYTPSVEALEHIYWCGQARLYISKRRPTDHWRSERYLRQQLGGVGRGRGPRIGRIPDAALEKANGECIAIEIELSGKNRLRLAQLLCETVSKYATAWYFVTPRARVALEAAFALVEDVSVVRRIVLYDLSKLQEP